ncbi:protease modulator HflC [Candidatus Venteria ishoeyi]|uniref:Protein HflC n=1 Tax=Candidatus Venteria ishoeyi TaxID=1899563 RepID=A0A1H6F7F3_9GAMM|nr:protease modulator HflC [Candidatus Venteria ishoeyi]MDM8545964.1 protease modulator HflC [Candidatus Venteria ishoeyi]SEH06062.1 Modulator of FtsH protease HflC [Candidatus Venteria ishoeyi]
MGNKQTFQLVLAVIVFMLFLASLFTVQQTEYALKLRFGKVVSADFDPGLNFKLPFVDRIRYFERRIQTLDAPPERFLTSEKKNLIVDSFVKWRIVNVEKFYTSVGGNELRAGQRLAEIIAGVLRSKIASRTIKEVVSGDRAEIMSSIAEDTQKNADGMGIKVVDVRIKQIDLPQEVSQSVYKRMEAERERVAKDLRSRGEAEAVRIQADADRQKIVLLAEAHRKSEEIRGLGDAESAKIYADAFSQDKEFYSLYRSLNAYEKTFNNKSDVLVVEPDSEFFKYFNQSKQKD